jgi:multidrug resistance efflux pump
MQRLKTTTLNATRAHANLDALRASLAAQGQAIRPDLLTSMAQVDALVEQARAALEENDLASAEDDLRRAGYELRKVFQAVGG